MKEKINSVQFASCFALCIISSSIGLSLFTTIRIAGIDSYISVLIGGALGVTSLLLFFLLFNYEPDKPLNEKITLLLGKTIGSFVNVIICIFYFIIGGTIIFNFANFIVSQYLSEVPLVFILIILGAISLYAVSKGIEVITRVGSISLVIVILFFMIGYAFLIREVKIDNLKPILEFGISKPFLAGLVNMLISLSPIYTVLIIPKNSIVDSEKASKYVVMGYLGALGNLFLLSFISNSILGRYLTKLYQYPGYISLKRISVFGFIDRIENFLSIHWILSSFMTITLIIYFLKRNIVKKERCWQSYFCGLVITGLMIIISYKVFRNNTNFNNYVYRFYPYILAGLFGVITLTCLVILIRKVGRREIGRKKIGRKKIGRKKHSI